MRVNPILHAALAALVPLALGAPTNGGGSLPSVDQIIARYAAARGGYDKLKGLESVVYRGIYREGEYESPHAAMALMRPYYKLVGDPDHPSLEFAEGYDGSAWELYGDPGVVLRTVGAASAAGRHGASIDGPLIDYAAAGSTVALLGIDTAGGRRAYRLLVRMRDGFEQEELIDARTWLLVAERKAAPVHAFGAKVAAEERIGDYRSVNGILFPFAHLEVEIATGKVLNQLTWTSIELNRKLDPALFSPPGFTRTAEQRLLEQLYAERSDAAAVLWTYHDFRRANSGTDTRAGVEFIGYQMAKMGDHPAAIELLRANEADYPRAASAAFALGRAYVAAGEVNNARSAFERALAIDPRFERAAKALEALP
jgi:Tetratricopeptide repeat